METERNTRVLHIRRVAVIQGSVWVRIFCVFNMTDHVDILKVFRSGFNDQSLCLESRVPQTPSLGEGAELTRLLKHLSVVR